MNFCKINALLVPKVIIVGILVFAAPLGWAKTGHKHNHQQKQVALESGSSEILLPLLPLSQNFLNQKHVSFKTWFFSLSLSTDAWASREALQLYSQAMEEWLKRKPKRAANEKLKTIVDEIKNHAQSSVLSTANYIQLIEKYSSLLQEMQEVRSSKSRQKQLNSVNGYLTSLKEGKPRKESLTQYSGLVKSYRESAKQTSPELDSALGHYEQAIEELIVEVGASQIQKADAKYTAYIHAYLGKVEALGDKQLMEVLAEGVASVGRASGQVPCDDASVPKEKGEEARAEGSVGAGPKSVHEEVSVKVAPLNLPAEGSQGFSVPQVGPVAESSHSKHSAPLVEPRPPQEEVKLLHSKSVAPPLEKELSSHEVAVESPRHSSHPVGVEAVPPKHTSESAVFEPKREALTESALAGVKDSVPEPALEHPASPRMDAKLTSSSPSSPRRQRSAEAIPVHQSAQNSDASSPKLSPRQKHSDPILPPVTKEAPLQHESAGSVKPHSSSEAGEGVPLHSAHKAPVVEPVQAEHGHSKHIDGAVVPKINAEKTQDSAVALIREPLRQLALEHPVSPRADAKLASSPQASPRQKSSVQAIPLAEISIASSPKLSPRQKHSEPILAPAAEVAPLQHESVGSMKPHSDPEVLHRTESPEPVQVAEPLVANSVAQKPKLTAAPGVAATLLRKSEVAKNKSPEAVKPSRVQKSHQIVRASALLHRLESNSQKPVSEVLSPEEMKELQENPKFRNAFETQIFDPAKDLWTGTRIEYGGPSVQQIQDLEKKLHAEVDAVEDRTYRKYVGRNLTPEERQEKRKELFAQMRFLTLDTLAEQAGVTRVRRNSKLVNFKELSFDLIFEGAHRQRNITQMVALKALSDLVEKRKADPHASLVFNGFDEISKEDAQSVLDQICQNYGKYFLSKSDYGMKKIYRGHCKALAPSVDFDARVK